MNFLSKVRIKVNSVTKHHWVRFFSYPLNSFSDNLDYDAYWRHRRSGDSLYLGIPQKLRLKKLINIINGVDLSSAVDVGGADGSFVHFLQEDVPYLKQVVCIDSSAYALQKAENNGIKTVQIDLANNKDLEKIPEADLIYALEVLEHVPNSEKLLREMYNKADKMVVFSFPNTGFITYRTRLLFGRFPMQWVMHPSEHLRYWTVSDVKWWLNALGYKNYKIYTHRGVPVLKNIFPNLFSADIFVCIKK